MRNGFCLLSSCSVQLRRYNNEQYLPHSERRKNNIRISDFKTKLASQSAIKKKCENLVIPTNVSFRTALVLARKKGHFHTTN